MKPGRGWSAAAVAALGAALGARLALAQVAPPTPSPCRASGTVTVAPKLACPLERVDVTLTVHLSCPVGEQPARVQRLRVVNELPAALQPLGPGDPVNPQPAPALDRTILTPTGTVTLTHRIRATAPGRYLLAGAHVELEDDAGRVATASLEPGLLIVSASCPRSRSLYLPLLSRPACLPPSEPADLVLVVDRSTSVGGAGLAEATRQIRAFLDELALARDRVALVAFDQRAELIAPLGSPRAELERALAGLAAAPGPRLETGIQAAAAELAGPRARPGRRRVLLLITDGVQLGDGGDEVVMAAAAQARAAGISIFSLALGPRPNLSLLVALSGQSGKTVQAAGPGDLPQAYRQLADATACAR